MDDIDRKLIDLLIQDARQSSKTLGKKLTVNSSTVRRRISKLVKEEKLRIIALSKPTEIGLPMRVIIALSVMHDKLTVIASQIANYPEIVFLAATSGRFDMMLIGWFSSSDSLYDFMQNVIGKLGGVRSTETFVCLHTMKSIAPFRS